MKNLAASLLALLLAACAATAGFPPSARAQTYDGLLVKDATGTTQTTCAYSFMGGLLNCQAIVGFDGTNFDLVKVDTSGRIVFTTTSTLAVSAASLPLPTGAATAANQATVIAALGTPFQAGGSIGNTAFGISGTLPAFASPPAVSLTGTLPAFASTPSFICSSGCNGSNASVGTNNATAPTSSTQTGMLDGTGKLQPVSSTNPLPVTGTVTASLTGSLPAFASTPAFTISGTLPAFAATPSFICSSGCNGSNASVGTNAASAPTSSTQVGTVVAGNLQPVSSSNPLPITGSVSATLSGSLPAYASTPAFTISGTLPGYASTPAFTISGTLPAFSSTPAVTISGTLPAFASTPAVTVSGSLPSFASTQNFNCVSGCGAGGTNLSVGSNGTTAPTSSTQVGFLVGANLQPVSSSNPLPATTVITGTLPAFASPPAVTITGTPAVSISGTLPAFAATPTVNLGTLNGAATAAGQNATITALGSPMQNSGGTVGISGTLPAFTATPTFNIGTAPTIAVSGTFWQTTQPISAASLPLPTGAATATGLSTINTTLGSPMQQTGGSVSISGTPNFACTSGCNGSNASVGTNNTTAPTSSTQMGILSGSNLQPVSSSNPVPVTGTVAISGTVPVSGSFYQATQPVSASSLPLPTGAATSALQASGNSTLTSSNASLSTLAGTVTSNTVATGAASGAFVAGSIADMGTGSSPGANTVNGRLAALTTAVNSPIPTVSYSNITTATTTTVKSGAGSLYTITINTPVASATVTVYDNTSGSGTKIATITLPSTITSLGPMTLNYGVSFTNGLTIVTSGATDETVSYH